MTTQNVSTNSPARTHYDAQLKSWGELQDWVLRMERKVPLVRVVR